MMRGKRSAFTLIEITASMSVLAVAMLVLAQLAVWCLTEHSLARTKQTAVETAANVLEAARATPWDELTPAWATAQRLPESLQERDWELSVRVEPEPTRHPIKRVTVEVRYWPGDDARVKPVQLVGFFSSRSRGGAKP
jgi:prepilin-type N-terminal cleavage/methylation domain-containing protein